MLSTLFANKLDNYVICFMIKIEVKKNKSIETDLKYHTDPVKPTTTLFKSSTDYRPIYMNKNGDKSCPLLCVPHWPSFVLWGSFIQPPLCFVHLFSFLYIEFIVSKNIKHLFLLLDVVSSLFWSFFFNLPVTLPCL